MECGSGEFFVAYMFSCDGRELAWEIVLSFAFYIVLIHPQTGKPITLLFVTKRVEDFGKTRSRWSNYGMSCALKHLTSSYTIFMVLLDMYIDAYQNSTLHSCYKYLSLSDCVISNALNPDRPVLHTFIRACRS